MRPAQRLAVTLVLLLAPSVGAASSLSSYGYWGFDLAATEITKGDGVFGDDFDTRSAGVRLYGGYRANDWVGIEGGLQDIGRYERSGYRASYSAVMLSGLLYAPVTRRVEFFGRAGVGVGRLEERGDDFSGVTRKPIGKVGAGVLVHANPHLAVRGGVDVYAMEPQVRGPDGGDSDLARQRIGMAYVGLNFLF